MVKTSHFLFLWLLQWKGVGLCAQCRHLPQTNNTLYSGECHSPDGFQHFRGGS